MILRAVTLLAVLVCGYRVGCDAETLSSETATCDAGTSTSTGGGGAGAGGGDGCPTGRYVATDVVYLGAFALPDDKDDAGYGFDFGGEAIAVDPQGDQGNASVYVSVHVYDPGIAGELSMPSLKIATDPALLDSATLVTEFADLTGGLIDQVQDPAVNGMLFTSVGLFSAVYTAHNVATVDGPWLGLVVDPHAAVPTTQGPWRAGQLPRYDVGYLAEVPAVCRARVGFSYVVGDTAQLEDLQGPAFFGFDITPTTDAGDEAPGAWLLQFTQAQPFVFTVPGAADAGVSQTGAGPHTWVNGPDLIGGLALPISADGTKSAAVFVAQLSTQVPHLEQGSQTDFPLSCFEGMGHHGWGLHPTLLFFDLTVLQAAPDGSASLSAPQPYLQLDLSQYFLPEGNAQCMHVGGVAYDSTRRRLFVSQTGVDTNSKPVIHVFAL